MASKRAPSAARGAFVPDNLAAFLAVAELGTAHAAAKALGIVQTAVTRRVQSFELAVGATLFLRSRRGMRLTEAGRTLVRYAGRVTEIESEALALVRGEAAQGREHLVVVGPSSLISARVIPPVAGLLKAHPGLTIEMRVADDRSELDALKRNQADVALLSAVAAPAEFDSRSLAPELYVVIGPRAWKGRRFEAIVRRERIVDFDGADDLTTGFLAAHGFAGLCRTDRHFVNNTHALASLVAEGAGYTAFPADLARPLVAQGVVVNIGGQRTYAVDVAVAWYARRYPSRAFEKLMAILA